MSARGLGAGAPPGSRPPALRRAASGADVVLVAVVVGLAVGSLTAYGQGWLGRGAAPLANSAGPWAVAAFLVARRARTVGGGAASAIATLWWCEIGYVVATELRGGSSHGSTVLFWLVAGSLAGVPLGVAAAWSTGAGRRRACGLGVVAGVALGEAGYGWTTLDATTGRWYWAVELVVGLAVIGVAAWRRPARDGPVALVVAGATALAVLAVARTFGA